MAENGAPPAAPPATVPGAAPPATPPGPASPPTEPPAPPVTPTGDEAAPVTDEYDTAFADTLGKDIATASAQEPPASPQEQQPPPTPVGDGKPQFTAEQLALLSRQHVTPEMMAVLPPEQQTAFLSNAAQREGDQRAEFNRLKQAADSAAQQPPVDQGTAAGEASGQEAGQPPATPFLEQANAAIASMAETFGEDIKPLGKLMEGVNTEFNVLRQEADHTAAVLPVYNRVIADMSVDMAVAALASDFPSLSQPEARNQVVAKFKADWGNSPHKNNAALGPLERVRHAMRDAATATFTSTESAAQANLVDTTKQRLTEQPVVGTARGTPGPPVSTEDLYNQKYEELLAPEVRQGR